MPQQTFSRKANGETPFTINELHDMADALGYDVRDLLVESHEMWERERRNRPA